VKIPVHQSLKVARNVVRKIDLPKEIAKACCLCSWSNGREQGYSISQYVKNKQLVIAECRNSDSIIVVYGNIDQFDMQTNQPNESIWQTNRKSFRYDKVEDAAKFIMKYFSE